MKFLNLVMADFVKSIINAHTNKSDGLKEKPAPKEEEKQIARAGMGDYDYENFPIESVEVDLSEIDHFDLISNKTKSLIISIDSHIAENFEEQKHLENKLSNIERELLKRKKLFDICTAMCKEETVEIEKCSQKNKKIDTTIDYLEQMIDSWQCLIDEFRKIPDERE